MLAPPESMMAVVVIGAMIFIRILRRLLGLIIRLAVFCVAVVIAAAGVTMILNNETIFERPGFGQRVERFLRMTSAASSTTGSSSVVCVMENPPPPPPTAAEAKAHKRAPKKEPENQDTRNDLSKASPAAIDDVFPELIRRGFPGISRD